VTVDTSGDKSWDSLTIENLRVRISELSINPDKSGLSGNPDVSGLSKCPGIRKSGLYWETSVLVLNNEGDTPVLVLNSGGGDFREDCGVVDSWRADPDPLGVGVDLDW
jgi:hypothetical protein